VAEDVLGFRAEIDLDKGMQGLLDGSRSKKPSDEVDDAYAALEKRGLAR
jgi:hypothetical protein